MSGNLSLRPINAELTHNTDTFSRMDPYVKFILGGQVQQSSVAMDQGKHPSWNDQLSLRRSNEDVLTIEVWDKDQLTNDDLIGSCSIALSTILQKMKFQEWLQLSYKGGYAGKLLVEISFIPDGGNMMGYGQNIGMQNTFPGTNMTQPGYGQPLIQQQQMGFQQQTYPQQTYPQQTFVQQTIPQKTMPQQQVYPQQGMMQQQTYPQQQTCVQQTIPQQGMMQQQAYPQQGVVQQQAYPQQGMVQQQAYPQQGMVQQPRQFVQQQGYPQQGYPQQGFYH